MKIPVVVDCREKPTFRYRMKLCQFGLKLEDGNKYRGEITKRKVTELQEYCRANHLKFYTDNGYGTRDAGYRARFFRNYKPVFGRFYFCAYCGRLMTKKRMTVDHLYPVAKVSRDLRLQKKLQRQGIKDLNSEKNLVAACYACNQEKSAQMGSWITRGKIGRHAWVWMVRWALRFACLVVLVLALQRLYFFLDIPAVIEKWRLALQLAKELL